MAFAFALNWSRLSKVKFFTSPQALLTACWVSRAASCTRVEAEARSCLLQPAVASSKPVRTKGRTIAGVFRGGGERRADEAVARPDNPPQYCGEIQTSPASGGYGSRRSRAALAPGFRSRAVV